MEDEKARWSKIATALTSKEVQSQAKVWELDRLNMLELVRFFWQSESMLLKTFWEDDKNSDSRSAIVLTALEDIPEGFVGILMAVCCPELVDVEDLIGPNSIPALFEMLVNGQEKGPLEQDAALIAAELPPQAMRLLQLARANALLNFLQNVLLLYQQVDVSVPHIDLATRI